MKKPGKPARKQSHQQPKHAMTEPIPPAPAVEQIQIRAYELYLARGGAPGRDWEDWLLAESELKAALGAQAIAPD